MSHAPSEKPDTYLRVAELWRRDEREQSLSLVEGYYANHSQFEGASRELTFPLGLGLIGRCSELGRPVLLDELSPSTGFLRSDVARQDGLALGLALPLNGLGGRPGVLALFFAASTLRPAGGVEVWERNPTSNKLTLCLAHHGPAEDFRRVTSQLTFDLGHGLPGRLSQRRVPELLAHLDEPSEFMRALAAETSGFDHAIGFPAHGGDSSAVVFIGHSKQPVALNLAIWRRDVGSTFEAVTTHRAHVEPGSEIDVAPWLKRAERTGEPVVFNVAGAGLPERPIGGLVLPFFTKERVCYACSFIW